MPGKKTKKQTGRIYIGTLSTVYRFEKNPCQRASACGFCSRISSKNFFWTRLPIRRLFSTCLFPWVKGPNTGYVSEMNGWNSRVLISRLRVIGATYSQKTKPPHLSTNRRMGSYITSTLFAESRGRENYNRRCRRKSNEPQPAHQPRPGLMAYFSHQIVC